MKKTFKMMVLLALAVSLNTESNAQGVKLPQASSSQTITQNFGLGKITVSYSRPNVKGRKIFGGLELYGNVWRTGANSATMITFTDEVKVAGQNLPAGEYGLFSPKKTNGPSFLIKVPSNGVPTNIKKLTTYFALK